MAHAPFLILAILVIACPPAGAQMRSSPEQRYCEALSELYMRYVGKTVTESSSIRRNDADADRALSQCRHGDAIPAIPVLERKLANNGFTLPARN